MKNGKYVVFVLVLGVTCAYALSARAMVVKNTLPHAKLSQQILFLINSPYQLAAPHRDIFNELWLFLFPVAHATAPPCNHLKAQPTCQPECPPGMCYCSGMGQCSSSGCTPYICKPVGIHAKIECFQNQGKHPCEFCEDDQNDNTCTPQ
jgi:hypothetical protein